MNNRNNNFMVISGCSGCLIEWGEKGSWATRNAAGRP